MLQGTETISHALAIEKATEEYLEGVKNIFARKPENTTDGTVNGIESGTVNISLEKIFPEGGHNIEDVVLF